MRVKSSGPTQRRWPPRICQSVSPLFPSWSAYSLKTFVSARETVGDNARPNVERDDQFDVAVVEPQIVFPALVFNLAYGGIFLGGGRIAEEEREQRKCPHGCQP